MNISALVPAPQNKEPFKRRNLRFIPERSGCYALATFSGEVLYIGLAENLRRRCNQHLDTPQKTAETELGRAVLFHWLECAEINKVERTWLGIHLQNQGALPIMNKMFSPVST